MKRDAAPRRMAALLFRRVGDSLMATPALRAIKQKYPSTHVTVLAEPQTARVFEHNPWINELSVIQPAPSPLQLTAALRRVDHLDTTLDFLSDPRSALACFLSGAAQRIGFDYRWRRWAYTNRIAPQNPGHPVYSVQHKLALSSVFGCDSTDITTDFFLTDADRHFADDCWLKRGWINSQPVVAFFVHSRRTYKRWPLDNFAELFRRLQQEKLIVPLLLATPGDEESVAQLRSLCDLSDENIVSPTDLGQLGAILSNCRLLVGNDGGPKHIAVALNVPTITIFLADSPVYWTPPDSSCHVAIAQNEISTASSAITAAMIYNAIVSQLGMDRG